MVIVDGAEGLRAQIKHPRLIELLEYWVKLKGDRKLPLRSDLDPAAIPRLLPNIILNEVELDPLRFRIRLEGEQVSVARGFNAAGRYFDEPGVVVLKDDVLVAYKQMVEDGKPRYSDGAFAYHDGRGGQLYRLAVPFSLEGETVDFIVVGFYHEVGDRSG